MRQRVFEKLCAYLEKYKDMSHHADEDFDESVTE